MTSRQITAVALKIAAIYLLFVVAVIPQWWLVLARFAIQEGVPPWKSFAITAFAFMAWVILSWGIAFLFWRLANHLIRFVERPPIDDTHVNITPRRLEEMLFRLLGVYLVIIQLKDYPLKIYNVLKIMNSGVATAFQWELLCSSLAFIFGMLLVVRPGTIINILDRIASNKSQNP